MKNIFDANEKKKFRFRRYRAGQRDEFFNRKVFIRCALHGLITAAVIFFVSYFSFGSSTNSTGFSVNDVQNFGFLVATILVIVVNLENALEMWFWTWIYVVVLFGTILLHFLFHFVLHSVFLREKFKIHYFYIGVFQNSLSMPSFWFTLPLICVLLLLPVLSYE